MQWYPKSSQINRNLVQCCCLQRNHGGEERSDQSTAGTETADGWSAVARAASGGGSGYSLDTESGTGENLSRATSCDGGGDGSRNRSGGG
jgi:hypothetical protein